MKYDEHDIPQFQEEICNGRCKMKGKCITEGKDNHWFLMCPHYFNWKIGYVSFIEEQDKWNEEHPEEVAQKKEQNKELAKKMIAEKKAKKITAQK